MNIMVVRHVAFESLGNLEPHFQRHGCRVTTLDAPIAQLSSLNASEPDLLVVLGGPISVYEEAQYPFIKDELKLIERRIAANLPVLGICLGSQLIAKALDARVYSGGTKEIGWSDIELLNAGRDHPVRHLAKERTQVLHWHGDTFDLPQGAVHLASSKVYQNQAFSFGDHVLALQFHPEVTAEGLELWYVGHAAELSQVKDVSVQQLRADARLHATALQSAAHDLWSEWLEKVLEVHHEPLISAEG